MKSTETNVYVTEKGNSLFWLVKNMDFFSSTSLRGRWAKKLIFSPGRRGMRENFSVQFQGDTRRVTDIQIFVPRYGNLILWAVPNQSNTLFIWLNITGESSDRRLVSMFTKTWGRLFMSGFSSASCVVVATLWLSAFQIRNQTQWVQEWCWTEINH